MRDNMPPPASRVDLTSGPAAEPRPDALATPIDTAELRQVLSTFVTGVTVITTRDAQGMPQGVTANSFNSVSLEPPLVLWSQALHARSFAAFQGAERFAVNILAEDQIAVSTRFAKAGEDKFGPTATRPGLGGVPLIDGCSAHLECRRVAAHPAGDHMIFIGQVERIARTGRRPLAFGGGRYLSAQPHDFGRLSSGDAHANRARLQAVRLATHAAVELSAQLDQTLGVAVWGTHGPTVVHWELARSPVSMNLRVGAVLPVLGSATGLAFAAWLPDEDTSPLIDGVALADAGWPLRLQAVRDAGMARMANTSSFVDTPPVDVHSVSVPVFDAGGRMLLALTALAHSDRMDIEPDSPVPRALKACAADLTRRLVG
jgi:flavin reductase (DIM6/NTAB) family NADH-FMN oxidoreductase RutF/DNA-binding IclR family transcriptional regulator